MKPRSGEGAEIPAGEPAAAADDRFEVFVSYRRVDGWWTATWLRRALLRYRLPDDVRGNHGLKPRVFLDHVYGRATNDFYDSVIAPALRASKHMAVVVTPAAVRPLQNGKKNWVQREIEDFLRLPQAANIVPILAGPPSHDRLPAEIEERYRRIQYLDFRLSRWRPLRFWKERVRRREEFLRLVAAVFDVPQDDMEQLLRFERRRSTARAAAIASASLVIAVLVVALALFAFQQWGEAVEQREIAEQQRKAAEEQRELALGRQLIAQSEMVRDEAGALLERSVLLALEASLRAPSLEADRVLRAGVALLPRPDLHVPASGEEPVLVESGGTSSGSTPTTGSASSRSRRMTVSSPWSAWGRSGSRFRRKRRF